MTNEFKAMFDRARRGHAYWVESAVLEFTEDLVKEMDRQGISRSELARRIDTSPAYITKILRGSTNFTLDTMVKVARALNCSFRCHLEPEGARTQWFDVLENRPATFAPFANRADLDATMKKFTRCEHTATKEMSDDSFALVS